MSDDNVSGKNNKEENDMVVRTNDVKANLAELKKRTSNRSTNVNPSKSYVNELEDNAKLLYAEQRRTIK